MTDAPLSLGMLRDSHAAATSTPAISSVFALTYRCVQPVTCRSTYPCGCPRAERGGRVTSTARRFPRLPTGRVEARQVGDERGGSLPQQVRRKGDAGGRLVAAQDHPAHALHQVGLRADERLVVAEGDGLGRALVDPLQRGEDIVLALHVVRA